MSQNLTFNLDGPVKVSEEDFRTFQEFFPPGSTTFRDTFGGWVCWRHTDGFRRLCLRNLLRQPVVGSSSLLHNCYDLQSSPEDIFTIYDKDPQENERLLHYFFSNNPDLHSEIVTEFYYALEQGYYNTPRYQHREFCDTLIVFLLTLPDDNNYHRNLWKHHSTFTTKCKIGSRIRTHLSLCANPKFSPTILRELWEAIETTIDNECHSLETHAITHPSGNFFLNRSNSDFELDDVDNITRWISDCIAASIDSQEALATIERLISRLETKLPSAIYGYLRLCDVIKIAPLLPKDLAIKHVKRHVSLYTTSQYLYDNLKLITLHDLEWLLGFCTQYIDSDAQRHCSMLIYHYLNSNLAN